MINEFKTVFLLMIVSLFVTGCASVGSGDFSCSGIEEGINCSPASALYNLVDQHGFEDGLTEEALANHQNRTSSSVQAAVRRNDLSRRGVGYAAGSPLDSRNGSKSPAYFGKEPIIPHGDPDHLLLLNPPRADSRDPVRINAVEQRVWIAPWVNKSGVWHGQQVIHLEITAKEWQNGIIGGEPAMPIFKPLD